MQIFVAHGKGDPAPLYGYYFGNRDDVIVWVNKEYPGFKGDLKKGDATLEVVEPVKVTTTTIKEFEEAIDELNAAEEKVKRIKQKSKKQK